MTRNTDTHSPDPPQTKTKHTTQVSGGWVSVLLIILVFCVVCFVFVCGGPVGWVFVFLVVLVFCVMCFVFVCGGAGVGRVSNDKQQGPPTNKNKTHNTEN
jgi:uncharacterized membrane protein